MNIKHRQIFVRKFLPFHGSRTLCHLVELQYFGPHTKILIELQQNILWLSKSWQCQLYTGHYFISVTKLIFAAWGPKCMMKLFVASSRASSFMQKIPIKLQNLYCYHCKNEIVSYTMVKECFCNSISICGIRSKVL